MLNLDEIHSHWREPLNHDVTALIEEVERLRKENERLRHYVGENKTLRKDRIRWQGEADQYKACLSEMMELEQENHEAARELYAVLESLDLGRADGSAVGNALENYRWLKEDPDA